MKEDINEKVLQAYERTILGLNEGKEECPEGQKWWKIKSKCVPVGTGKGMDEATTISDIIKKGDVKTLFDILDGQVNTAKKQYSNDYASGVKTTLKITQNVIKAIIKNI